MRQSNVGARLCLLLAVVACDARPSGPDPTLPEVPSAEGPEGADELPSSIPVPPRGRPAPGGERPSRSPPAPRPGTPTDPAAIDVPAAHHARCADGFHPRAEPRVDVLRLGLLCGPSNGLVRWEAPMLGYLADDGIEGRHRMRPRAKDCVRLVIVADATVEDLEVDILESGRPDRSFSADTRWALVPPDRPVCFDDGAPFDVVVRTHAGRGDYVVQAWRSR